MEQSMQVAVNTVKKDIDKADESQAHLIFLNRHGEIDMVSEQADVEGQSNFCDVWDKLRDEATSSSGGPYFEILSIAPGGRIFILSNEYLAGVDDDTLAEGIKQADGHREWFYEERVKAYGPSAYPTSR